MSDEWKVSYHYIRKMIEISRLILRFIERQERRYAQGRKRLCWKKKL